MSKNYLRAVVRLVHGSRHLTGVLRRVEKNPPECPQQRAAQLSAAFAELCRLHNFDIEITGNLPVAPSVVVANHLSYLDPVVLLAKIPGVPIAKSEIGDWPVFGPGCRALGVLLVERNNIYDRARVLRGAVRALRAGVSVINFPEGTTTDGSMMLPFHRGIFGAARLANVPVVPVGLTFDSPEMTWTGNQTLLPHYFATAARQRTRIHLNFGQPIPAMAADSAEDLSLRARLAIQALTRRITHDATERLRVPETRPDPILSAAAR